jgi:hypothetical protein
MEAYTVPGATKPAFGLTNREFDFWLGVLAAERHIAIFEGRIKVGMGSAFSRRILRESSGV